VIAPSGRNRYPCDVGQLSGRRQASTRGELSRRLVGGVDNGRMRDDCRVMRTAMQACSQAVRVLVRRRHVDHMRISTALCCEER
jgi:hypothetical protein